MKATSFLMGAVLVVAFVFMVSPSMTGAASDNFIQGLSIQLGDFPTEVWVGKTFTMTVKVVNQSGQVIEGRLRTYAYTYTNVVAYPPPEFSNIVNVNEGGWSPNEMAISLDENENEKTYVLSLTVRPDLQLTPGSSGQIKLRARLRQIDNNVNISPHDTKFIVLLPKSGPEAIAGIKLGISATVAVGIVVSVAMLQQRAATTSRKRPRRKR